jgi:O-acetylserine/cysteine efflux transporter
VKPRDLFLGVLVTLVWGSNFSVIAIGLRELDPFLLTGLRFAFTAFPLILLVRRPRDVPLVSLAAYGLLFSVGLWWVVNLAMAKGMSPGLSSLVLQCTVFFTVILSAFVFREAVRGPQLAGMLVAAIGLFIVIRATSGTSTTFGVILVLLAAVSWSVCNLIVKRHKPKDMIAFIAWSSAFSAPVLFLLTWVNEGNAPFVALSHGISWAAWGSVLFQAYITTVFGYMVWNNLMKKYPAASVAPLSLLVPVSGIVTSYLAFDEHFATGVWAGAIVMLAGVALFVCAPLLRRLPVAPVP